MIDVKLKYINAITATFNPNPWIDADYFKVNFKQCIPRPMKVPVERPPLDRPMTPWRFEISVFKDYLGETEKLIGECFDFDFKCIRVPKLTISTLDEFKSATKVIYPLVRSIYKRLSAAGVAGIVLAVGWNEFRNLIINTLKMTDG